MIQLQKGDILKADAEALVNTVNCVGVMGRGIALQFKKAYPDNFKKYKAACEQKEVCPGRMFIFETGNMFNPRYIINFPTKRHWRGKSRVEDITSGLNALADEVRKRKIRSIAIPPLGCGLGGLDWNIVRSMIEKTFEALPDVQVVLFEPAGAPAAKSMARNRRRPNMTNGRAALLSLMNRYLQAAMDPFVTLLEIHKLMYFAQEAGEPLRLSCKKGMYGPYAENLRHVLNVIEGHFITGYADASDNPDKQIELKPNIIKAANDVLKAHPETTSHLERVADLISGFETPYGMELLSTVHWVATREQATTSDMVVRETYAWNKRKRMFQEKHIRIAFNTLTNKNWISGSES
jgi:O-acetyl-ADP-ribose deacetylase (regulator of RNase III)